MNRLLTIFFFCCSFNFWLSAQELNSIHSDEDEVLHFDGKSSYIVQLRTIAAADSLYTEYLDGKSQSIWKLSNPKDHTFSLLMMALRMILDEGYNTSEKEFKVQLEDYILDPDVKKKEKSRCMNVLSILRTIVENDQEEVSRGMKELLFAFFVPYILSGVPILPGNSNIKLNLLSLNGLNYLIDYKLFQELYTRQELLEMVKQSLLKAMLIYNPENTFEKLSASSFSFLKNYRLNNFDEKLDQYMPIIDYIVTAAVEDESPDSYTNAFQAALLRKNLLLQKEVNIKQYVYESNDKELIRLYEEITTNPVHEDKAETQFMRLLSTNASKDGFLYARWLRTGWEDIRQSLHVNNIAIEFVRSVSDTDTCYYALTLDKDCKMPRYHFLCKESDLKPYLQTTQIAHQLYDLLWKPLEEEIDKAHDVYFAADGLLHTIPMEYLFAHCQPDSENIKHRIYRLSSTRELCNATSFHRTESVTIYGGIDYECNNEENTMSEERADNMRSFRQACQATFEYLPGTLFEALYVDSICKQSGWQTTLLLHRKATKESFFDRASQPSSIIHIATHGFWITDNSRPTMMRSGLMMTEGPLFSAEISSLNLRNLDHVTLSACNTGLGDILSEGVFGLQRGFKKAGANSILMSLWKVDDEATCKLMTEFYSNWIAKKMTKHDALEAAKKTIRETKGWEDPKYWAAFILLDALK